MSRQTLELKGQRFGRLVVTRKAEISKWGHLCWLCKCDCGKIIKVRAESLCSGNTQSCGCLQREKSGTKVKHGHAARDKTKTYRAWQNMLGRCNNSKNPAYKHYGSRGIKVCERWAKSFENFLADMGVCPKGLTIERINNNRNYEPNNCKWATYKEQGQNNRGTKLTLLKVVVIKKLLKESHLSPKDIAEIFNITRSMIYKIKLGRSWSNIAYTEIAGGKP